MGVGVFARLQHTPGIGNGTRELRTGSRSVLQYGTRIRDCVPARLGDRVAVHRDLLSGLLGAIQRVGALCFW
jgi:hypothetical protein